MNSNVPPIELLKESRRLLAEIPAPHNYALWNKMCDLMQRIDKVMGGATPELTDARVDASEGCGSVVHPMEETPPANSSEIRVNTPVQPVEATKPSSDYKATRGILAPYLPEEPNPTSDKDTTHD